MREEGLLPKNPQLQSVDAYHGGYAIASYDRGVSITMADPHDVARSSRSLERMGPFRAVIGVAGFDSILEIMRIAYGEYDVVPGHPLSPVTAEVYGHAQYGLAGLSVAFLAGFFANRVACGKRIRNARRRVSEAAASQYAPYETVTLLRDMMPREIALTNYGDGQPAHVGQDEFVDAVDCLDQLPGGPEKKATASSISTRSFNPVGLVARMYFSLPSHKSRRDFIASISDNWPDFRDVAHRAGLYEEMYRRCMTPLGAREARTETLGRLGTNFALMATRYLDIASTDLLGPVLVQHARARSPRDLEMDAAVLRQLEDTGAFSVGRVATVVGGIRAFVPQPAK